ncbi:MAG: hypothetical protein ACI865_000504 [Flavobacteriaceae bacterium]|jgi:hypothetical protein
MVKRIEENFNKPYSINGIYAVIAIPNILILIAISMISRQIMTSICLSYAPEGDSFNKKN